MYHSGPFNDPGDVQRIRITDGCPNQCSFCYCPPELKYHGIPVIERPHVQILDMNLLANPNWYTIISELGTVKARYELVCGIDYRYLTPEKAETLKKAKFTKMRFAWDGPFTLQKEMKKTVDVLSRAGFKDLSCFILCNWKIPVEDNLRKLDLLKIWGVKACDCWFDGQVSPDIKPVHWKKRDIRYFRRKCRKHNQMVLFGIDPEIDKYPRERVDRNQTRLY